MWALVPVIGTEAPGAEGSVPAKISLVDAIALSIDTNANLKRAEQTYQNSLSRLRIAGFNTNYGLGSTAYAARNPDDVNLSSRVFGSLRYSGFGGTEGSLELSPFGLGDERGSLRLSLRHPLMQGRGPLSAKSDLFLGAQTEVSIQSKEFFLSRQSTILGVIEAYYGAVLAREQVKVQEDAVRIAEDAEVGARKRAEAGLVAEIEVSRASIRLSQTQDQLNRQIQRAKEALDRLMVAIGSGVGESPELIDSIPVSIPEPPALAETVKLALANRSELAISDEDIANQERKLALASDALRPNLDIVAGFNSTRNEAGIISGSLVSLGSFNAGVELRFPLDKRITLEEQDVATRNVDVLNKLRVYKMEQITEQVLRAYRSVESSRTSLEIFGDSLKVAEDNLRLAQRMVEEGLASNREVLEAEASLTQAKTSLLAARTDLYLSHINLNYAMGEDLTTVVTR